MTSTKRSFFNCQKSKIFQSIDGIDIPIGLVMNRFFKKSFVMRNKLCKNNNWRDKSCVRDVIPQHFKEINKNFQLSKKNDLDNEIKGLEFYSNIFKNIEKLIPENLITDNYNNIQKILLHSNKNQYGYNAINDYKNNIEIMKLFIHLINTIYLLFIELKFFNSAILNLAQKLSKSLNDFESNPEYKSYTIKDIFVDPNQNFIYDLTQDKDDQNQPFNFLKGEIEKLKGYIIEEKRPRASADWNVKEKIEKHIKQNIEDLIGQLDKINENGQNSEEQENVFYGEFICEKATIDDTFHNILFIAVNCVIIKSSSMYELIESISEGYGGYQYFSNSYEEFIQMYEKSNNDNSKLAFDSNKEKIIQIFNDIQVNRQYFYIDLLFQIIIKNLLFRAIFISKIMEIIEKDGETYNSSLHLKNELSYNNSHSVFRLAFDDEMNFYMTKSYSHSIKKELINREISILTEKVSKFIVQVNSDPKLTEKYDNRIVIPFFPFGTFESILYKNLKEKKIVFTSVDKFIMIYEIATALKDLHASNHFHGNLSDQSIFISAKKDAYIGGFCYDRDIEMDLSKLKGPLYFRAPENFDTDDYDQTKDTESDEYINGQQLVDIYSFGVLMHEILSEKIPESRMDKFPTEKRLNILKGNYCEFLFSGAKNECFETEFFDLKGDMLIGFKEIIQKCMKKDPNERFSSMNEIIYLFKLLPIYERNIDEIEYRFQHSISSSEYNCSLSDIVECYYRGDSICLEYIKLFLDTYHVKYDDSKDLLSNIFDGFNIKFNENSSLKFEDIFNLIIQKKLKESYFNSNNEFVNGDDSLLSISNKANFNRALSGIESKSSSSDQYIDFVMPISSLKKFIENNQDKMEELSSTFIYLIAKELSIIHANYLYHGELSTDTIGVYYNHTTQTFVPSIILYYSFYKRNSNHQTQPKTKRKRKAFQTKEKIIEKIQKKDMKSFCNIIKEIHNIPNDILNQIESSISMNIVLHLLYNYIIDNVDLTEKEIFENNCSITDYSSYIITYSSLIELNSILNNQNYSFIDFDSIFQCIYQYTENCIADPGNPIEYHIMQIDQNKSKIDQNKSKIDQNKSKIDQNKSNINRNESENESNIIQNKSENEYSLISDINNACNDILKILHESAKNEPPEIIQTEEEIEYIPFVSRNLLKCKASMKNKKVANLSEKEIYRYIEFTGLCKRAFEFLLSRYVLNLNPNFKYVITAKITNVKYLDIQDHKIKLGDIQRVIYRINPKWKPPQARDGCIVIYINV